jgi:hypothetical protein
VSVADTTLNRGETAMNVNQIKLSKTQTAFISRTGGNGVGVVSGSVEEIADLLVRYNSKGCQIVFDTYAAPNFNRCFNAYTKRAKAIAAAAGVSLSEPAEYFIDGYRQIDKFVMVVQ